MTEKTRKTIEEYADCFLTKNIIKDSERIVDSYCNDEVVFADRKDELESAFIELGKKKFAEELRYVALAKLAEKVMGDE